MLITQPYFIDTVTHIPAVWANAVTGLVYDVFGLTGTKAGARAALELGSMALQSADNIQIVGGSFNNVPIGLDVPMQGRFTVLSVEVDPIAPEHVVNKRYLTNRLAAFGAAYLPLTGGVMTGPLLAYGDPVGPLDVVPRRWVDFRILAALHDQPVQRWHVISTGQTSFTWIGFARPAHLYPENFLVYIDGIFQTLNLHYTLDLLNSVDLTFDTTVPPDLELDVVYVTNMRNVLEIAPPIVPLIPLFSGTPAWSNPINMRINYAVTNGGQNQISVSQTVLRDLYISCVITTGALVDRIVTWSTQWLPATIMETGFAPILISVSATEAKISLREAVSDHYYEGRLEITMLIDGVPEGNKLYVTTSNQITPDYTDGLVSWGIV